MSFFRRRATIQPETFTVGTQAHRVVVNSPTPGIRQLHGLSDYVESVSRRRPAGADGRDTIAVLNAKMDHAEQVNDLVGACSLAYEDLVARGVLRADEVPPPPPHVALTRDLTTYDYIQQVHARAVERRRWLDVADAQLYEKGVALIEPLPPDPNQQRP